MSKTKLLSIVIVLLLTCNLVLLCQQWQNNKETQKGEGPRKEIIARLNLDEGQIQQYNVLIQQHRHKIREKEEEIRQLKKALYQTLIHEGSKRDSILGSLSEEQRAVELINLQHFEEIGRLCRPEQQGDYRALVTDLSDLFMHKKPPPPTRHQ